MPPDVIDNLADSFVRNAEFASPKASSLMLHSMLKLRARPSAMLQDAGKGQGNRGGVMHCAASALPRYAAARALLGWAPVHWL